MGFSPGEFKSDNGEEFHWELTQGRVVLWDNVESNQILRLSLTEAREALRDLELLVAMLDESTLA